MEAPKYVNRGMGNPKLMSNVMARVRIAVPPIDVQREIIHILDCFTLLTAELTARQKQYEYYRDNLLFFNQDICQMRLSEVCESIADGDHMPPPKTEAGIPFITISNITANRQIDFAKTMFVSNDYYEKLDFKRKAQEEDILYTVVGSFGTPVYVETDRKFVFQRHIAILRPDKSIIKPKYLYHAMQSTAFYKQANTMARGAAQRTISLSSLGQMSIFVPALDVQGRIVKILDNFDTICTDLNIGLPAEIEARQKQYEYYRDKLLSFKELNE